MNEAVDLFTSFSNSFEEIFNMTYAASSVESLFVLATDHLKMEENNFTNSNSHKNSHFITTS